MKATWIEAERPAKFYHTTSVCIEQIQDMDGVTVGEVQEARTKGIALCPDCEKVMHGSSRR